MEKKEKKKGDEKKEVPFVITHPNFLPRTFGQKVSDSITKWAGSWTFILSFSAILVLWILLNTSWILFGTMWDPRPFILLNLVLSCLAAFQAPIILMSQNRSSEKDRQRAEYDYAVNRKAEREIEELKKMIRAIHRKVSSMK